jgi:hypothetical protein
MESERESVVQTVEVTHAGQVHRASYFIEGSIIHADVEGLRLVTPVGNGSAADMVKAMLAGRVLQANRNSSRSS